MSKWEEGYPSRKCEPGATPLVTILQQKQAAEGEIAQLKKEAFEALQRARRHAFWSQFFAAVSIIFSLVSLYCSYMAVRGHP